MKNEMPQVFKDFLRKRRKSNTPAHPEQVSKYVDPDEFYSAVVNDPEHKWTWYSVRGEYCKGDPREARCVHFQSEVL